MSTKLIIKKPAITFIIHWIAWLLLYFITFFPTFLTVKKNNWNNIFFNYGLLASINFLLFYFIAFLVLPKIGLRYRKWILFALISIVLTIGVSFIKFRVEKNRSDERILHISMFKSPTIGFKVAQIEPGGLLSYRFRRYLQTNIYNTLTIIIIACGYRIFLAWWMDERLKQQLENEKLTAELSFLRMQINPHFLFNALNNIYASAILEKSEKTAQGLMKLSDLMRYMVYEKEDSQNRVALDRELQHINNYIDLENQRRFQGTNINFSIEGSPVAKRIAPLLLFPLIENAFKHGILTDPSKPVNISLTIDTDALAFSIENYKNDYRKDQTGGVGLENVKKRLDLIYQDQYKLEITDVDDKFKVNLKLPI